MCTWAEEIDKITKKKFTNKKTIGRKMLKSFNISLIFLNMQVLDPYQSKKTN